MKDISLMNLQEIKNNVLIELLYEAWQREIQIPCEEASDYRKKIENICKHNGIEAESIVLESSKYPVIEFRIKENYE